ncbi:hypothetical protein GB931_03400 [Modestobacter sp. I12A-02628]|uniref:DNA ligase (ATP) n=1 Tax=Goekera deserti TaxID=2497753 RepID=A0A7K3WCR8_9ACTN|nr:non-homologous end-joining DNA ligase [Goekera deserti]MPQ96983.1 hypothetical protein [Goekera deserti]NDI46702.1 hypothetical protein [Goekera deserti]NEL54271.1 hypothetical protein [Goekera deserti]
MLAVSGPLPAAGEDDRWGYEFKWDGVRAVSATAGGRLALRARSGIDITVRYPELARLPAALAGRDAVLDGEVVALDGLGRPDFGLLQNRMHRTGPEVAGLAAAEPVSYLVFDLLALDGADLTALPYATRRARLDELGVAGGRWTTTPWYAGDGSGVGSTVQQASLANALEGVVAKRLDSGYRPGARSAEWRKVKNLRTQSVVVGGWRPGAGRRAGGIGSLLVGVPDADGGLVFVGHVGTGFTDRVLDQLMAAVRPRPASPFREVPREVARYAQWVQPELVGEVAYGVRTRDGRLRHPVWRGLRDDLTVEQVVTEP